MFVGSLLDSEVEVIFFFGSETLIFGSGTRVIIRNGGDYPPQNRPKPKCAQNMYLAQTFLSLKKFFRGLRSAGLCLSRWWTIECTPFQVFKAIRKKADFFLWR
jgi:hypothetical protein